MLAYVLKSILRGLKVICLWLFSKKYFEEHRPPMRLRKEWITRPANAAKKATAAARKAAKEALRD